MSDLNFLKKVFKKIYSEYVFLKKPEFTKRIKRRDQKMYNELVKTNDLYNKFHESDSFEKWKNSKLWQIRLINKWNAKEFAKKMNIRVAELYWNGKLEDFRKFDLKSLPKQFIIKPIDGFSSKNVFIMVDGFNLFNQKKYSNQELRNEIINLYNSKPGLELVIEEFIQDENGEFKVPKDYRFYMFNGHLEFIRVDSRTAKHVERVSYYDKDWNLIDKKVLSLSNVVDKEEAPVHLYEMKKIAKKLSKEYKIFVRVDLFESKDGPVFGELTASPRAGNGYTKYGSDRLVKSWDKYCRNLI